MTQQWDNQAEMSILEHLEELREKIFASFFVFCLITIICFIYNKNISYLLQQPAIGIKFLQLAPGEYLFASIKIAIYLGFIVSSPFTLYQIMLFVIPGLTQKESDFLIPALISSIALFFIGIIFSYKVLTPAALSFLIKYGADIVEPIWSFEEYFNFILLLMFSTGIAFQIPIIQVTLGIIGIFSSKQMISYWKYIIFIATIIGAILTPSTDPLTQILMSLAIILLYFTGIIILISIKK